MSTNLKEAATLQVSERVTNRSFSVFFDTGAEISIVREEVFKTFFDSYLDATQSGPIMRAADGTPLDICLVGKTELEIPLAGGPLYITAHVVRGLTAHVDVLLGHPDMSRNAIYCVPHLRQIVHGEAVYDYHEERSDEKSPNLAIYGHPRRGAW